MNHNIREDLIETLAALLEVDEAQINDQASMDTLDNWDSVRQLNLILSLEQKFGVEFTEDEIVTLVDFPSILSSVQSKLT